MSSKQYLICFVCIITLACSETKPSSEVTSLEADDTTASSGTSSHSQQSPYGIVILADSVGLYSFKGSTNPVLIGKYVKFNQKFRIDKTAYSGRTDYWYPIIFDTSTYWINGSLVAPVDDSCFFVRCKAERYSIKSLDVISNHIHIPRDSLAKTMVLMFAPDSGVAYALDRPNMFKGKRYASGKISDTTLFRSWLGENDYSYRGDSLEGELGWINEHAWLKIRLPDSRLAWIPYIHFREVVRVIPYKQYHILITTTTPTMEGDRSFPGFHLYDNAEQRIVQSTREVQSGCAYFGLKTFPIRQLNPNYAELPFSFGMGPGIEESTDENLDLKTLNYLILKNNSIFSIEGWRLVSDDSSYTFNNGYQFLVDMEEGRFR